MEKNIKLFESKKVRTHWDEEQEKWYFSIIDVIDYRWKDKEEKTKDVNGDWWTHSIKDETQLKEQKKLILDVTTKFFALK